MNPGDLSRRDVLRTTIVAGMGTVAAGYTAPQGAAAQPAPTPRQPDLVRRENQREGATDWQLSRVRIAARDGYRSPFIEGYCSRQSVRAGEKLAFMVSTNPAKKFQIEIFRMGYYGGRGARLMTTLGPLAGATQPDPEVGERRLRECRWEPSAEITIPADWPSGVYLGRLGLVTSSQIDPAWQSYTIFIVRDDRAADVLFQCSDNTWQAYNRWPDSYSLYVSPEGSLSALPEVSFDRPYGKYVQIIEAPQSVGSGEFLLWEYPLCYWLEQHGYDVTYCSNSDMLDAACAKRAKVFLSVGHDEYWDLRQYHACREAIDAGTSALFLSGNAVCFHSPYRAGSNGTPNRIISRAGRYGDLTELEKPKMGPFPVTGLPNENLLMGARTITPFNGGGDWVCAMPDHWLFDETGMQRGDAIAGLVGWEFHGDPANLPGLEVVAEGIAMRSGVDPAHWTATVYPGPKGNVVFNASTIFWSQGLSSPPGHMLPWSHWARPHGPDRRVQQITHNALRRAIG